MDIDKDDNLYILDYRNRRIQIFNTEGEVQKIIKLGRSRQDIIRALPSGLTYHHFKQFLLLMRIEVKTHLMMF